MRRPLFVVTLVGACLALVAGVSYAALRATTSIEASASVADADLSFTFGTAVPASQDFTGDMFGNCISAGSCTAEVADGALVVGFEDIWNNSAMRVGPWVGPTRLWIENTGPVGLRVLGPDFSGAPGYGAVGSGEPIEVAFFESELDEGGDFVPIDFAETPVLLGPGEGYSVVVGFFANADAIEYEGEYEGVISVYAE